MPLEESVSVVVSFVSLPASVQQYANGVSGLKGVSGGEQVRYPLRIQSRHLFLAVTH